MVLRGIDVVRVVFGAKQRIEVKTCHERLEFVRQ